jgi:hypothetical protein
VLATQYSIALPLDYDMSVIRQRVAERGHLLDAVPGLGLKAYLVEDVGRGGRRNQYAPFYLWSDPTAAAAFFWGGGGFSGIVRDFGRPSVATWLGAAFRRGPAFDVAPTAATITRWALAPAGDPADEAARLRDAAEEQAGSSDLHSVAAVIDPFRWEALLFALRISAPTPPPLDGTVFEVLHVSAPAIDALSDASTPAPS